MDSRPRTLTFGDDRSAPADTAWGWITAHTWPGWVVDVVTITIPQRRSVASPLGFTELAPWDRPDPRLAPESCGFAAINHLAADNDPRVILGVKTRSDLVVVGPRGQGLLKALHLGSTAEWLMRCPNSPLLVVRQPVTTRSILACVDGSHDARAAVACLAAMPWIEGTSVTVLGVTQGLDDDAAAVPEAAAVLRAAGAAVTPLVVRPDPPDMAVNPRMAIFTVMEAEQPDLVVLGTSGLTGLARLWVGSVASAVARHAHCSVLLVRDPHGGDDDDF
jgi:nucleotide-binding universal stress UspA family protein